MPRCETCHIEHLDIVAHYARDHQPVNPRPRWNQLWSGLSNEFVSDEPNDDGAFCFQCSRQFNSPDALNAHLTDAQVHGRAQPNNRIFSAFSRIPYPTSTNSFSHQVADESRGRSAGIVDQSRYGSESDYSGSDMSVSRLHGATFGNEESSLSNNHQHGHEREQTAIAQEELYAQRSSEYEYSDNSHEEMDTDTDRDDDASVDDEPGGVNHTQNLGNTRTHSYWEQSQTQYHDIHERTTMTPGLLPLSYNSSAQHIPTRPGPPPTSSEYYPNRTSGFSYQERKSEMETYCKQCPVPHRVGSSHCGGTSASAQNLGSTPPPIARSHGIICPICLDPAVDVTSTLCGHVFCAGCIRNALQLRKACPVCKRPHSQYSVHPIYPAF